MAFLECKTPREFDTKSEKISVSYRIMRNWSFCLLLSFLFDNPSYKSVSALKRLLIKWPKSSIQFLWFEYLNRTITFRAICTTSPCNYLLRIRTNFEGLKFVAKCTMYYHDLRQAHSNIQDSKLLESVVCFSELV